MSQRVVLRLTKSEGGQVERQHQGEVAVWSCRWVEWTRLGGRLLSIRQRLIDGGSWEKQKGEQTLWLHPLSQCCWPVCHWYTGRSSTSAYRQHNGYSLQLECTVLISWLHIISSAWLIHFLFAPSTSLTQHSDHTMNLLMLRSQSTYELSSQFVGIKDGNVMIQHLQRWLWGCIRGSRACSESTAWCWTASPWHTAAREDTCHQTTGTAYWTRNNVCIWKSKCTQIITSYITMQLHMV